MVLTGSLQSFYRLNEGTASTLVDDTGSGHTLAFSSTPPTWTQTILVSGLNFNVGSVNLLASGATSPSIAGNFTVSAWVNSAGTSVDSFNNIVEIGNYTANAGFGMWVNNSNLLDWRINQNINHYTTDGSAVIDIGSWNHFVITYNGALVAIYKNGSIAKTNAYTTNPSNITTYTGIGNRLAKIQQFRGKVDEVGFWNRAIGSLEVADMFDLGFKSGVSFPWSGAAGGSNFLEALADGGYITDNLAQFVVYNRDLSDNGYTADSFSSDVVYNRSNTDSFMVADAFAKSSEYNRTNADSIDVADSLESSAGNLLALAETLSVSDNLVTTKEIQQIIADSINISDSPTTTSAFLESLTETLTLADALDKDSVFQRSLADGLSIADVLSSSDVNNFKESLTETLSLADNLLDTKVFIRDLTDSLRLTDSLSTPSQVVRLVSRLFKLREGKRIKLKA